MSVVTLAFNCGQWGESKITL